MASIKDVAKLAGVSPSTVSRFLSGKLRVKSSTRARIEFAISKLGYKRNLIAGGLAKSKSGTIGLIVPNLSNFFYACLAETVGSVAFEEGYRLLLCVTDWDCFKEGMYIDFLGHKLVDGLLYVGTSLHVSKLLEYVAEGLPIVILDEPVEGLEQFLSGVFVDNYSGAFEATKFLIELGHRRIAFIGGCKDLVSSRERFRGFIDAMMSSKLKVSQELILWGNYTYEWGGEALDRLFERSKSGRSSLPTAVFASCDLIAIGFMERAKLLGLTIPGDISVIGFDDIPLASWVYPPLTTVKQPYLELGRTAVSILKGVIERKTNGSQQLFLKGKLIVRSSTRKIA